MLTKYFQSFFTSGQYSIIILIRKIYRNFKINFRNKVYDERSRSIQGLDLYSYISDDPNKPLEDIPSFPNNIILGNSFFYCTTGTNDQIKNCKFFDGCTQLVCEWIERIVAKSWISILLFLENWILLHLLYVIFYTVAHPVGKIWLHVATVWWVGKSV